MHLENTIQALAVNNRASRTCANQVERGGYVQVAGVASVFARPSDVEEIGAGRYRNRIGQKTGRTGIYRRVHVSCQNRLTQGAVAVVGGVVGRRRDDNRRRTFDRANVTLCPLRPDNTALVYARAKCSITRLSRRAARPWHVV